MIIGVGMDLVDIARFDKMLEKDNELLVKRLLSDGEMAAFLALTGDRRRAEWLAGRFAAKEALMKALGLDLPQGIGMHDIEVLPDHRGKPGISLSDAVRRQLGFSYRCQLSITHTAATAGAVVVIEQEVGA
ncbi:holo-ACP synthase [Paenibacillus glycinis]|uniref:Holo-[acyl-carrier-protein] synthase n=1 Tax=Paenibacillus glycinis TaxID=2697035 RepID=A0ABW9XR99_9BACL|nr:holo-ACP synthase [Paenibacillus glycinis]NBD25164.1 holo-[acyl-carrier-protein] synthase [Paenibacillus glycinis]